MYYLLRIIEFLKLNKNIKFKIRKNIDNNFFYFKKCLMNEQRKIPEAEFQIIDFLNFYYYYIIIILIID